MLYTHPYSYTSCCILTPSPMLPVVNSPLPHTICWILTPTLIPPVGYSPLLLHLLLYTHPYSYTSCCILTPSPIPHVAYSPLLLYLLLYTNLYSTPPAVFTLLLLYCLTHHLLLNTMHRVDFIKARATVFQLLYWCFFITDIIYTF